MFDSKLYDEKYFRKANEEYGFEIKFLQNHLTEDTAPLAAGADVVCALTNEICYKCCENSCNRKITGKCF